MNSTFSRSLRGSMMKIVLILTVKLVLQNRYYNIYILQSKHFYN